MWGGRAAPRGGGSLLRLTSGVPPTTSSTEAAMRGRPATAGLRNVMAPNPIGNAGSRPKKRSDMVHGLGRRPPLHRLPPEVLERRAVHHRVHSLHHSPPEVDEIAARVRSEERRVG